MLAEAVLSSFLSPRDQPPAEGAGLGKYRPFQAKSPPSKARFRGKGRTAGYL